jgi:hypothetical protein
MADNKTHTTEHEIEFIRRLEHEGKRAQLKLYRKALRYRSLTGYGMNVDRTAVERELNRILGRESTEEKGIDYAKDVARVASEWLNGGRMRAISQKNTLAGKREI